MSEVKQKPRGPKWMETGIVFEIFMDRIRVYVESDEIRERRQIDRKTCQNFNFRPSILSKRLLNLRMSLFNAEK